MAGWLLSSFAGIEKQNDQRKQEQVSHFCTSITARFWRFYMDYCSILTLWPEWKYENHYSSVA
jgi:hypothetical protein